MPVVCEELTASRRRIVGGDSPSAELIYGVRGTDDDVVARTIVQAVSPSVHDGLYRQTIDLEPDWADTDTSNGRWTATVRYVANPTPQTEESSFSFETSGGTQHLTQSLETIGRYAPAGDTAPDYQGAVGVTHDSVEGVDIAVPVYAFSETHYKPASFVTLAYRGTLFSLTGKVNSASFKGLTAGECLFLGARGSRRGAGDWEITYNFAASPNRTSIVIGNITVPAKKGWEYLWVRYEDSLDPTANAIVKRPRAAYVEKVYELASFAALGIGT